MNLWMRGRDALRSRMNLQSFAALIEPLSLVAQVENSFLFQVSVPGSPGEATMRKRILEECLSDIAGVPVRVEFQQGDLPESVPGSPSSSVRATTEPLVSPAPLPYSRPLDPNATFLNFVVGSSNQFAHAACQAVANLPGRSYNPLFIYGGSGLGKTHLLNAVGNFIRSLWPHWNILYLSSEEFTNELVHSIRYERLYEFRSLVRSVDVLLIDDIQSISGKEQTQEEFFHTFNSLHQSQRQIVLTSDKIPRNIAHIEERLRSRFEWGLITDVQPPEFETRLAILQRKAESMRIGLPDDVAVLLATQITSNIRELEGALSRLRAASAFSGRPITKPMALEVLHDVLQSPTSSFSIDLILRSVAAHYNVQVSDLKSHKRLKNVTTPRHVAMYLCRILSPSSFPDIGSAFGGKDHSTVIHAYKKIQEGIDSDPSLKSTIQEIRSRIEENEIHAH